MPVGGRQVWTENDLDLIAGLNLPRQETTAKMGFKAKRLKAGWDGASPLKLLARSERSPRGMVLAP